MPIVNARPNSAQDASNIDAQTVEGFGREWARFDQASLPEAEATAMFDKYFSLLDSLDSWRPRRALDVGCGSGRFARFVAPRSEILVAVDPSPEALEVAKRNLDGFGNVHFHLASVANLPVADGSCDLVYALGVLHHVPDTAAAVQSCTAKLVSGGRLLLYLYYRFDHRPVWFRLLWRISDGLRRGIARLPFRFRRSVTDVVAVIVYWPLARLARITERRGFDARNFPLYYYRNASLYSMRTDALDRFGTLLERRFTQSEIELMLRDAGLTDIRFRDGEPYWCVVATKPPDTSSDLKAASGLD